MPQLRDGDVKGRGVLRLEHRRRSEHLRHILSQVLPDITCLKFIIDSQTIFPNAHYAGQELLLHRDVVL